MDLNEPIMDLNEPFWASHHSYGAISSSKADDAPPLQARLYRRPSSSRMDSFQSFLNDSLNFNGSVCSVREFEGQATIPSEIVNIAKNIVGAGVLSLSGGIALYSDSPTAIVSACVWIIVLGATFGYFCLIIAKVCQLTNSATYRECWQETMGTRGALAVSVVEALLPALGNLSYSTILSQTLQSLLLTVGLDVSRIQALLMITIVVLLPLCLLKNIAVLAPLSVVGTAGIMVTAIAMLVRYIDGSYQPGGQFFHDIAADMKPSFGHDNMVWSVRVLPFVCMVFESWVMHYNSPRFYTELKHATIPRFATAVLGAFGLSAFLFMAIAAAGYLTFGGNSDGYILNNYSPRDPLATLCRLMIGTSTLSIFPIAFIGFRDGVLDILELPPERQTSNNLNVLTVILLTLITGIAMVWTDLGRINAVGGGTLATAICFVFPAVMYKQAVSRHRGIQQLEANFVLVLMMLGVVIGVTGVWEAMK